MSDKYINKFRKVIAKKRADILRKHGVPATDQDLAEGIWEYAKELLMDYYATGFQNGRDAQKIMNNNPIDAQGIEFKGKGKITT